MKELASLSSFLDINSKAVLLRVHFKQGSNPLKFISLW